MVRGSFLLADHVSDAKKQYFPSFRVAAFIDVVLAEIVSGLVPADINTHKGVQLIGRFEASNVAQLPD